MKRVISLLLAILTVVAIFAGAVSCGDSGSGETNKESNKETSTNKETESSESKPHESSIFDTYLDVNDNLPDNLNFGGEAINILSQDREGWTSDEVSVASINSTPINDAIFLRNQTVSDRINVKIKPNKVQNDSPD